jgi:hypothetical protein
LGYRIAFQLFVFSLPFIAFGLYLLASASAAQDGRRRWPIQALFAVGFALSAAVWIAMIVLEDRTENVCHTPPSMENGVVIPGTSYECEQDVKNTGVPATNDPGGQAKGATYPEDLRDSSEIAADSPNKPATEPVPDGDN